MNVQEQREFIKKVRRQVAERENVGDSRITGAIRAVADAKDDYEATHVDAFVAIVKMFGTDLSDPERRTAEEQLSEHDIKITLPRATEGCENFRGCVCARNSPYINKSCKAKVHRP